MAYQSSTRHWGGIGVGVFAVALLGHLIDSRIPGPLIGLVISTMLVGALHLHGHGVAVLGLVAHGGPRLGLPGLSLSALGSLAPIAGVVALIVVSQTAATTRAFAEQGGYQVEVGRDFVGVGAGSVVAGLVGAFPVNAKGIVIAVALAILDRTRLSDRPALHVLGRITGTTSWTPVSGTEDALQLPGVLVVLFATPLWYANAARFRAELDAAKERAIGPLRVVVLDTIGMNDVDYTGSQTLRQVLDQLDRDGVRFAMARTGGRVRAGLGRSDLLERIGRQNLFASVDEAVVSLELSEPPEPPQ